MSFDARSFLAAHGIPYKLSQGGSGDEARMPCPVCGGSKNPFAINFSKGTAVCYRCQWVPKDPKDLVQQLTHCNPFQAEVIAHKFRGDRGRSGGSFTAAVRSRLSGGKMRGQIPSAQEPVHVEEKPPLEWPASYYPLGHPDIPTVNAYAFSRGFSMKLMVRLRFGGCLFGRYAGCLVIPAMHGDELMFWQARDALNRENFPKYRSPKGYSPAVCLFNLDEATTYPETVICEGVFSAMRVGQDAVACFGNKISRHQIKLLMDRGVTRVVLCFDPDTWTLPRAVIERGIVGMKPPIYNAMMFLMDAFEQVRVVKLKDGDPDDTGHPKMRELIDNAPVVKTRADMARLMMS